MGVSRAVRHAEFGRAVARSVHASHARSTTAWPSTCSRSRRTRACSKRRRPEADACPAEGGGSGGAAGSPVRRARALSSAGGSAPFDSALRRYVDFLTADGQLEVDLDIADGVRLAPGRADRGLPHRPGGTRQRAQACRRASRGRPDRGARRRALRDRRRRRLGLRRAADRRRPGPEEHAGTSGLDRRRLSGCLLLGEPEPRSKSSCAPDANTPYNAHFRVEIHIEMQLVNQLVKIGLALRQNLGESVSNHRMPFAAVIAAAVALGGNELVASAQTSAALAPRTACRGQSAVSAPAADRFPRDALPDQLGAHARRTKSRAGQRRARRPRQRCRPPTSGAARTSRTPRVARASPMSSLPSTTSPARLASARTSPGARAGSGRPARRWPTGSPRPAHRQILYAPQWRDLGVARVPAETSLDARM